MYLTKKGNGKHMFLYAFGHYACLPIGALTEKKGEAENPSKSIWNHIFYTFILFLKNHDNLR